MSIAIMAGVMMAAMLILMPGVLLSTIARAGEAATRQMAWFIFVLLMLPGLIVFFTGGPTTSTASILVVNLVSLSAGVYLGLRSARREAARLVRSAEQMSTWGKSNFARLDVNGDGLVCALDLANFSKNIGTAQEDLEMASRLSYMLNDLGHSAENGNASKMQSPRVASLEDFVQYGTKKRQLFPSWI